MTSSCDEQHFHYNLQINMEQPWIDKQVKFDVPFSEMKLKIGEKIIDKLDLIEDTKGNGGDKGRLIVTNLRVLWYSVTTPRISLSIGYSCIVNASIRTVNSRTRGTTRSIHILALANNVRFEFIFTSLLGDGCVAGCSAGCAAGCTASCGHRKFASIVEVHRAYVASVLYRELKMRGAVVHNKRLRLLGQEQVYTSQHGVWNLSSDQGNLGTLVLTNVRVVWFADMNEGFNISLPYLQMSSVVLRDSKFGTALVVSSSPQSGGYVLGFKMDPEERLQRVHKELCSLHQVYSRRPIYGVDLAAVPAGVRDFAASDPDPDSELLALADEETRGEMSNTLTAYLAVEGHVTDRDVVFNGELGLAVECLKDNITLHQLWEVIPQDKVSVPVPVSVSAPASVSC